MPTLSSRLLLLLAVALTGQALAQAPVLRPQWSVTFDARQRINETSQLPLRASWTRLTDGGALLLSRNSSGRAVLRDYDAGGALRATHSLIPPHSGTPGGLAQLAADRSGEGAYVVSSSSETDNGPYHFLYHYRPGEAPRLVTPLPYWPEQPPGAVVGLQVLEDDAVVLRRHSISRIQPDGFIRWSFGTAFSDDHFDAYDLAQAPDGKLWVVGQGGPRSGDAPPTLASVWRFLPGGRRMPLHQFRCEGCSESRALGIALRPDGSAVVVGRSGAGEPGFVTYYAADGTPGLRVYTPASHSYDRVVSDTSGNVYALSATAGSVDALDASGQLRWSRAGNDLASRAGGVLVSRPPSGSGALVADAVDADGTVAWSRELASSDGLLAGGAAVDAAGHSTLVVETAPETGNCGKGPRLVSLDVVGLETGRLVVCTQPSGQRIIGISSAPADGALANLAKDTYAISADARRLWQYQTCEFCSYSANWNIAAQQLLPGGGAWLLAYEQRTPPLSRPLQLLRIGAGGAVLLRAPVDSVISGNAFYAAIVPDGDDVILLGPTPEGLEWARFSAGGELLGQRAWQWQEPLPTPSLRQWHRWPDGGISLLTYHRDYSGCDISPPICPPGEQHLLRLAPDGSLLWRHYAGRRYAAAYAGFEDDGTTVLLYGPQDSSALQLRQVDASGVAGPMVSVSGSEGAYIDTEAGPVRGRYLVSASQQMLLLDRSGSVLRRLASSMLGPALTRGSAGFLVASQDSDAVLLSADDLTTLASFDLDGRPGTSPSVFDAYWQLQDDGSVYTAARRADDGLIRPRISRFAVPGTPAADLIFIARFD